MKKRFLLLALPAILLGEPLTLTITFTNIQTTNAPLGVLLFNQADGFPSQDAKARRRAFIPSANPIIQFENLNPGTYAISVFQDLNQNQKCDTNWLGIPTEPYGFSNNRKKLLLAPRFKRASFSLSTTNTAFTVPLID